MGSYHHFCALFQGQFDGRQRSTDTRVAGYFPVFTGTFRSARINTRFPARSRSVILITDMVNPLVDSKVLQTLLASYLKATVAIANVVSSIRLAKPHSLSHQTNVLIRCAPLTRVWVPSTMALCGSWLKSTETNGNSV